MSNNQNNQNVRWDEINKKIEEVVTMIKEDGLTMVSATFGNDELNNWQYKIWIPKRHQTKRRES